MRWKTKARRLENWRLCSPIPIGIYVGPTVYRFLKELDLIANLAFVVIKAAEEFKYKTTAIHQLRQTDFTELKNIALSWFAAQNTAGQ